MLFGIVPSVASLIVLEMLELVTDRLLHHPDAEVKWPTHDEMPALAARIRNREEEVHNVIGFVDTRGRGMIQQCALSYLI